MKRIVIKFGLISGVMVSLFMLVSMAFIDQIGIGNGEILGYTGMVVSFLMVYFGVRSYRDTVLGGRIRFGQAFRTGALISLISCTCYVATWEYLYFGGQAANFEVTYSAAMIEKARASGATPEAIAAKQVEMEKFQQMYRKPLMNIAMTFLEPLPVALLFTLVSAGLLSRSRRDAVTADGLATDGP